MKLFILIFNGLKNKYAQPTLFKKRVSKHNAYKNIMFYYEREDNNSPKRENYNRPNKNNKLINELRTLKKEVTKHRYNNSLELRTKENNKNNMERLKELQKKYDKIYEKKRSENTSVDDKYRKYIFRKNKTNDVFNVAFDEEANEDKIFKAKLLKKRINIDRKGPSTVNISHEVMPSFDFRNKDKFNTLENESEMQKIYTPRNNKIIVIKKVKVTPKITNTKNKEIVKVYNIKDIVTPDKRLYVYINYITLSNKMKKKTK